MRRKMFICLCLLLFSAFTAGARENDPETSEAKELSGMSIVGNDEAPKALYIIPWKSSDIGVESSLDMMLDESDVPVDRDVFMRHLDFYEVSTAAPTGLPRVAEQQK